MLNETEMLDYVYQATDMGRDGVASVLKYTRQEDFRQALKQQQAEYDKLWAASSKMLRERGERPKGVSPVAKLSAQMMTSIKAIADPSTSKLAEMMIQGSTMGMTKSLKHLHDYNGRDERVQDLADKLLKTEQANIEQMQKFL